MAVPHKLFLSISLVATFLFHRFASQFLIRGSLWWTGLCIEVFLISTSVTWSAILYPKLLSPLRKLPQPSGGSFINGQFWRIFREPSGAPHREWMNNIPNDGLLYYTSFLNGERILLTSPEALREVLTSKSYEFVKPAQFIRNVIRILGNGVLFAEGDEHRRQRKALMPAFSYRHIKELYPVFWGKTRDLVLALDKTVATTPEGKTSTTVSAQQWASRSTLDIIGVAGMDKSFNAIEDEHSELFHMYQRVFTPSRAARIMQFTQLVLPAQLVALIPFKQGTMITESTEFLRKLCRSMVKEKHEKMKGGKQSGIDILSIAIESGGFSDEDLVDQMMTFLAAGHETTATALTWALSLLAKHRNVQQRLRSELRDVQLPDIRDPGSNVTAEELDRSSYLNAVCNEVLRFNPPVPVTLRQAAHDEYICGHFIPAKTSVIFSPAAINQSPQLWGPTAHEFNPDRWMEPGKANTGGADSNYAFMTFLHGPRGCIGQGFSKAEFVCLLAGWIQAFEVELQYPDKEIEMEAGLTQRPKGGLPVILTPVQV